MSDALIRTAFETRLKAWADANSLTVAFENVAFTPPGPDVAYVRAYVLPAPTGSDDLARAHRRYSGVYQASLVLPAAIGVALAASLGASLQAAFPINAPMAQGGVNVWLLSPFSPGPHLPEPARFVVPFRAQYRADTY